MKKLLLALASLCLMTSNLAMANNGPQLICNSHDYRVIVGIFPQAGFGSVVKTDGAPAYPLTCGYTGGATLAMCSGADGRTVVVNHDLSGAYIGSNRTAPLLCRWGGSSLD